MVYDFPNKVAVSGGAETQRAIAGLSDNGNQAAVLVSDFCGADMAIQLDIKGFENPSSVSCIALDDVRNNEPVECKRNENGLYTLEKNEPGAAAFLLVLKK